MESQQGWKGLLKDLHKESYLWSLNCCYHDREMAKDVLQTVYLKVYEGKAVFSGKASLKTWLFSVIKHTSIDLLRRHGIKTEQLHENLEVYTEDENKLNEKDQRHWFRKVMGRLSTQQREVLTLSFYHGLPLAEIAALLGISTGTARTHYERGKENFRKYLIDYKLDVEFLEK